MYAYLIRHAMVAAESQDPQRGITPEGRVQVEKVSAFLAKLELDIHVIWHSGKTRAAQTAGIVGAALGIENRILEHSGLNPDDDVAAIKAKLGQAQRNVAIVGHMPHLARLCAELLTGSQIREVVDFTNVATVCLARKGAEWRMAWMLTPDLLC